MKSGHNWFWCVAAPFLAQAAWADTQAVDRLKSLLTNTKTLTADFRQAAIDERGHRQDESFGKFYLNRPGRFRWDTTLPYKQSIVLSNAKVWFYDPDLRQVTVKNIHQAIGSTPALLLSGDVSLDDNFNVQEQGKDGSLEWVRLTPKTADSGFEYVTIVLETNKITGMELKDELGQFTRIYFNNIQINRPVDYKLFTFIPPHGTDIFEQQ